MSIQFVDRYEGMVSINVVMYWLVIHSSSVITERFWKLSKSQFTEIVVSPRTVITVILKITVGIFVSFLQSERM